MWDTSSFVIGILVGFILAWLICWIVYSQRTFIFTYCPKNVPTCKTGNYYNNPSDAIASGATASDILHVNSSDELVYKRVPNSACCVPDASTQPVIIAFPQYCSFTTQNSDGTSGTFEGSNDRFESPLYGFKNADGSRVEVLTERNCKPIRSDPNIVVSGVPVAKWTGYDQQ